MQVTPHEKVNTVSSHGLEKVIMGIDPTNLSMVAHMFRDQIYSDEKMAVVREYLCNAIDEHVTHGITRPVEVTLTESSIKFQDFAKGLPKDKILSVFFQYLASTKTGEEHGGFGIGAKSGHAYSDIFYVTSCFDGVQTTYAGVLEDNGGVHPDGVINILGSEPTTETGISVEVPLKNSNDLVSFKDKVLNIAKFSKNQFLFNGALVGGGVPNGWEVFENFIYKRKNGTGKVSVRLGDIVYPSSHQVYIKGPEVDLVIVANSVNDCSLPPSRESVKMDSKTTDFIVAQVEIFKEKLSEHLQELYDKAETHYERFGIRTSYSLRLNAQEAEAEVLELSDKVGMAYDYHPYSGSYCGISSVDKGSLIANFHARTFLFHKGLSHVKKQYFAENIAPTLNWPKQITFVQFENEKDGEEWTEALGIPSEKVAWSDSFTFPKVQRTKEQTVKKIRRFETVHSKGSRILFDPTEKDRVYLMSNKRQPVLKYSEDLYTGFEMLIIPTYLKSQIPDSWVHADTIIEKKLLDFSQKLRDNLKEYVKYRLWDDHYSLVQNYTKFKGLRNPVFYTPTVDREVINLMPILEDGKVVEETVSKIVNKIQSKTDTWQYRAVMALGSLGEQDYKLAKSKILA